MRRLLIMSAVLGAIAVSAAPSVAQRKAAASATPAGTFLLASSGDWGAYTSGKDRGKVCYAMSQPKERGPKGLTRDPAYVFISNRPGDGARNEFSIIMGYALKPGGASSAAVDGANFQMLTKDKSAWLKNAAEEAQLLNAMKKGATLTVKGVSIKGNETTDRYSLTGLGAAVERAQKECQ